MPRSTDTIDTQDSFDVPTDDVLREMREQVDASEHALANRRAEIATAIRQAVDGGVSMAHVARTVGWSRQWCYHVLERWSANGGG